MRKLALVLIVLWSCKKDDSKPAPAPTPTPVPVVKYYEVNVSAKPAVYTQTASPMGATDLRDSSFFFLKVNGAIVQQAQQPMSNINVVLTDSVKTGDQVSIEVRMRTYTQNAKEAVIKLNKAWLMSPETILSSASSKTVPVTYTSGVGKANQEWIFTAP